MIVGGLSMQKQRRILKRCPDIIVATPGRFWELFQDVSKGQSLYNTPCYNTGLDITRSLCGTHRFKVGFCDQSLSCIRCALTFSLNDIS